MTEKLFTGTLNKNQKKKKKKNSQVSVYRTIGPTLVIHGAPQKNCVVQVMAEKTLDRIGRYFFFFGHCDGSHVSKERDEFRILKV